MILTLHEIARLTGSNSPGSDQPYSQWSIDTRTLTPGAFYIALRGENHDGHSFLEAAAAKGATAALVAPREHLVARPPVHALGGPLVKLVTIGREQQRLVGLRCPAEGDDAHR